MSEFRSNIPKAMLLRDALRAIRGAGVTVRHRVGTGEAIVSHPLIRDNRPMVFGVRGKDAPGALIGWMRKLEKVAKPGAIVVEATPEPPKPKPPPSEPLCPHGLWGRYCNVCSPVTASRDDADRAYERASKEPTVPDAHTPPPSTDHSAPYGYLDRSCPRCNKPIPRNGRASGGRQKSYCSVKCKNAAEKAKNHTRRTETRPTRPPCPIDGKPIPDDRGFRAKYCSDVCSSTADARSKIRWSNNRRAVAGKPAVVAPKPPPPPPPPAPPAPTPTPPRAAAPPAPKAAAPIVRNRGLVMAEVAKLVDDPDAVVAEAAGIVLQALAARL